MNKKSKFKASTFINNIYKKSNKPVTLQYCDDNAVYDITCTLNWTKEEKEDFIDKINNFNKDIKALSSFSKKEASKVFSKYFADTKKQIFKDHLKLRVYRLNKLYSIKTPQLIIDNELQLTITLLILNNYALKESITKKIKEDLTQYG